MGAIADWLEGHQGTCLIKSNTGVDCPGCGMQRSVVALLRGDFGEAWDMYPPIFPLLLTFLLILFALTFRRYEWRGKALVASFVLSMVFVVVNFVGKLV